MLTRRAALAAFLAAAGGRNAYSQSSPQAEFYGAQQGYPVPPRWAGRLEGNPWSPKYRVSAFTHLDQIYQTRAISHAATPWTFKRAAFAAHGLVMDYLARHPVTGLLIARDDRVLFEQYQYGRTDRDRVVSQSMVKSITGLLIGLAIADGCCRASGGSSRWSVISASE